MSHEKKLTFLLIESCAYNSYILYCYGTWYTVVPLKKNSEKIKKKFGPLSAQKGGTVLYA
jgi:hypothetical protein